MAREMKITAEDAAIELYELIRDCDGDTLAALYEYAFGAVENAVYDGTHIVYDFELESQNLGKIN